MADKVSCDKDAMVENFIPPTRHNDKEKQSLLPPLPCPHTPLPDQAYLQAAAVFQQLRPEKVVAQQSLYYGKKTDRPLPECGDKATRRQAYQLAFNTLKYQDLLEDVITDSCFHTSQHISSHLLPLAMVMLFDFQDRRFLRRDHPSKEGEEPLQEVRDLEISLQRCKTKLAASLARYRVKQRLQSVSCFLSDSVRTKQDRAKHLPLYAWVNTLKTSVDEVCEAFQGAGVREVENMADLSESSFCRDPLCPDTLVFSQQLYTRLQFSSLTITHALNTQDRSVSVAVSVIRPLLYENGDVLLAGSFSPLTVAHVAIVAAARSGRVLVCGADHTPAQMEEIQELFTIMDIDNVQVLPKAFRGLQEWDAAVQRLKVIVVLPQCSSSALSDPVATIHSEHGDLELLQDLSHGSVSKGKIHKMASQQARLLGHALSFSKVQTVVYCTRSVHPEENEQLVKRVLEKIHTSPKLLPFRVSGPIFPDDSESQRDTADSNFFRLQPSEFTNGCFAARLSRQADPTKVETVQEVLARAAAKGLLGGMVVPPSKTGKKGKRRKNRIGSASSKHLSSRSQEGQTGNDFGGGQTEAAEEHEDGAGECSEDDKEEDKRGKRRKKRRGLKGSKGKVNQLAKQTNRSATVSKHQDKDHKKRKANPSNQKRSHTKNKPRKIPRLTLTLISSPKPSSPLSSITALAHKLSQNAAIKSQQVTQSSDPSNACPSPPARRVASRQVKKQSVQPEGAVKTMKDTPKPERPSRAAAKVVRRQIEGVTEDASQPADFVLPPISSLSHSSLSSRSASSISQRPSGGPQLVQISPSTSLMSLPGL